MKNTRKRYPRYFTKFMILLVIAVGIYYLWERAPWLTSIIGNATAQYTEADLTDLPGPTHNASAARLESLAQEVPAAAEAEDAAYTDAEWVPVSDIAVDCYLELINQDHSASQDAGEIEDGPIVSAWPTVAVSTTVITLHETALSAVAGLFEEAEETGAGSFYVSSGYRGYDEQQQVYDESPDKTFAQPAGYSEHQTGLAADIMASEVSQDALAQSPEGEWLALNAWKHGLILRYPGDKTDITGISGEAWHFRYVGLPHAWYCMQNNWCWEEYLQFLWDEGGYKMSLAGVDYTVTYQQPVDGALSLPAGAGCAVSSDNAGGYIVTSWESAV